MLAAVNLVECQRPAPMPEQMPTPMPTPMQALVSVGLGVAGLGLVAGCLRRRV